MNVISMAFEGPRCDDLRSDAVCLFLDQGARLVQSRTRRRLDAETGVFTTLRTEVKLRVA